MYLKNGHMYVGELKLGVNNSCVSNNMPKKQIGKGRSENLFNFQLIFDGINMYM